MLKNTVIYDNKKLLLSLQIVKETNPEFIEELDPVVLEDVAEIAAEQMIFGNIFPDLWKRAK